MKKQKSYYYLASPYTHTNKYIRDARFKEICRIAGEFKKSNLIVFSPIAHSHAVSEHSNLTDTNWDTWKPDDEMFLNHCELMIVIMMDGWEKSVGIAAEIEIIRKLKKEIIYMKPEEVNLHLEFFKSLNEGSK